LAVRDITMGLFGTCTVGAERERGWSGRPVSWLSSLTCKFDKASFTEVV
jgi:hypothetical protein